MRMGTKLGSRFGQVLRTVGVLGLIAAALPAQAATEVRVAWLVGPNTPLSVTLVEEKLFEKYAKEAGYDVTVEWHKGMSGPPVSQALAADRLDFEMGTSAMPLSSRLQAGIAAIPIGIAATHISNAVLVRPKGKTDVTSIAKLEGKTVGTFIGTAAHYVLAAGVMLETGKSLDEAGIKLINVKPAECVKMPEIIDACATWPPFRYFGPQTGLSSLLFDADGRYGEGHENAGGRSADVAKSWAAPSGFIADSLHLSVREAFMDEHPDLVVAMLLAVWEAVDRISTDRERSIELAGPHWGLPREVAEKVMDTAGEPAGVRNAPIMLESDALAIIKASEFMEHAKIVDKAITWEELITILRKGAAMQKLAWEKRGGKPSVDELLAGFKGESATFGTIELQGGAPIWMIDDVADWGRRMYKPGPF
ncbi:ABC transporter substrate-binding protein [Oceanibacterium hippocampi]|uniref:Putative aliphatic sulfonates-binding protein n=1 Tax=Oceanibacterium hippocampi TaxID=745714 RepID=A0A1Y5TQ12_9PROT|nr:hypothetical protein [Oceanibacterium hippocampi]SLN65471.1 Putative aliphatic sulfonates-binding protein precursor [Oceanibacterium hippocampi]